MHLKTLEEIAEISSGRGFKEALKLQGDGIYVVGMADVTGERDEIDWRHVKKADVVLRSHKTLKNGDILFLAKGSLHKAIVVTGLTESAVATNHFFIIKPKQDVDSRFLAMALNNATAQGYFRDVAKGETKKHITKHDLGNFTFSPLEKSQQLTMSKLMSEVEQEFVMMRAQRENFHKAWDLFIQNKVDEANSIIQEVLNAEKPYILREAESLQALIQRSEMSVSSKRRKSTQL